MAGGRRTLVDLFLLIVGVFFAVAAERWVAGRADQRLAEEYTQDLLTDLLEDSVVHAARIDRLQARTRALARMIEDLNGTRPRMEGAEELRVLFLAQRVSTADSCDATYQDLVSSGNIRLLDAELRRSVVRYCSELGQIRETMTLSDARKPRFADLVPGFAKPPIAALACRFGRNGSDTDCAGVELDSIYAALPAPEREALAAWRSLPEVRMDVQSEITETNILRNAYGGTSRALQGALSAARAVRDRR